MNSVISVIVPTYNSEKTIERCLLSILKQTYENLEVIVVNDGSSDSTETICEKMASCDSRLKVITIKNGGVSHARNIGIDNAKGDYITFVDSDDNICRFR
ncbi:glycosyltransferase family 2 protein [Ruminococcus bromii]|nr:glycosyltransferase family 2 protein [Ruminococcus bromii]